VGIVSGIMLDEYGLHPGSDLNRMVGYAQQQDIHLATATVKEALRFSALLRQPQECPDIEKLAYVEEVIDILDMRDFADAVIGLPGEGKACLQRLRHY
jgi:ATP-binding cassette subfamily G (WHITE) protein 2 (PDR)